MASVEDPNQLPGLSIVSLADRPELGADLPALLASRWPAYMLEGHPGHQVDLDALVFSLPEYQLLLVSDDGVLCGSAIALPLPWRLGVCPRSMTITGTLQEWQEWLQQEVPDSGEYILPGGLAPMVADKEADLGVYVEANVWVRHQPRG